MTIADLQIDEIANEQSTRTYGYAFWQADALPPPPIRTMVPGVAYWQEYAWNMCDGVLFGEGAFPT